MTLSLLRRVYPVGVVLVLWELLPRTGLLPARLVPPFTVVAPAVSEMLWTGEMAVHAGHSLFRALVGLTIAVALAVPLGVAMSWSRKLHDLLDPLLVVSYPVPKPALIPLFMLWLGTGDASKIAAIAMGCLLPLVVTTYHGARGVDRHLVWSARSMGAGEARVLTDVVLRAASPQIMTGIKIAIAVGFLMTVSAEMIAAKNGLGYLIFIAMENGNYPVMLGATLVVVGLGVLADAAFTAYLRRALAWHDPAPRTMGPRAQP